MPKGLRALRCLHALSRVIETPGITLEELLSDSLDQLPLGFENSDELSFSIFYRDKTYGQKDNGDHEFSFFQPIVINEKTVGHLDVRTKSTLSDTEHEMLAVIAERLGRVIQRYETSLELERSREQFMLAVKGSNDGIWDWDLRTNSLFLSARWKEILGYADNELPNVFATFSDNLHPEDKSVVEAYVQEYLQGGIHDVYDREFRMRHKDGTYRWIRARGQAVRDESGVPFRMAGSHTDITSIKEAQEQLKKTINEFELIFSNSYVGIMFLRGGRRLARCNKRLAEILGYSNPDEMQGISMRQLHLSEDRYHSFGNEYYERLRHGEQFQVEYQLCRKDGTSVWCTLSGKALDVTDLKKGVIWVIDDLEPRKQSERELMQINMALEAATAKANAMAAQAEMANAAKSEFLANMSHEIRTPLNGVLGMLDLLIDTKLDPEQQSYVTTAKDSAASLLSLINDILDFSKIEAQRLELSEKDFALDEMIDSVCRSAAIKAHEKGLELICDYASDVPAAIKGDALRLRQILTNLVGNAIKFTAMGEVILSIKLVNEDEDYVELTFSVDDTGIGIPKEKQATIFDQFTQADSSTTRKYGGTGLGLAISKRLVELMEGQIGVSSTGQQGSSFWFTIRVKRANLSRTNCDTELKDSSVLIVDDNATNRFILSKRLRQWGVNVTEAISATEASKLLEKESKPNCPFDIALVDLMMPFVDGESFARELRENSLYDEMKLVLLASLSPEKNTTETDLFSARLMKPINLVELKRVLCELLGASVPARATSDADKDRVEASKGMFASCKGTVLIAEDNLTNQKVAQGILKKLGLRSEVVPNGKEAVRALEKKDYSLLLMDVQMPILDGIKATKLIRAENSKVRNKDLPIIAMTAHAMVGDEEDCLSAGMNAYVPKPINVKTLVSTLSKYLLVLDKNETKTSDTVTSNDVDAECFDETVLLNMLMGDEELAHTILNEFLADLPKQIDNLEKLLVDGSAEDIAKQAHTIKGASANVGAKALTNVARQIEDIARRGDVSPAQDLLRRIKIELNRLKDFQKNKHGE